MKKNSTSNPGSSTDARGSRSSTDDLAREAKEAVQNVTERVKETASEAVGEARHQAESIARQQQDYMAEKLECVCEALHDSAARMRHDDAAPFAAIIDQATNQIENLSSFLREKELQDMYEGAQNWARRNPVLFLGGCFVGGLLIARLLKGATSGLSEMEDETGGPEQQESYTPREMGHSRFTSRSGLEQQSSMGSKASSSAGVGTQYGSTAFAPTPGVSGSPGTGQTGSRGPAGSWEET